MPPELAELIKLGGGVALAGMMFWFYQEDRASSGARHQANTEQLLRLLDADQKTREDNTRAVTELLTWLKRRNGQ